MPNINPEMAEIALVRMSLKLVWGLIANRAIARLETGSPTDEKLRQLLLSEFRKLHEELDALRRKELVAATAFMENAYELLNEDQEEARKEFNKARDAAQVALGVVKELQDKVLATKIMIASAIHEFVDKPEVAVSACIFMHEVLISIELPTDGDERCWSPDWAENGRKIALGRQCYQARNAGQGVRNQPLCVALRRRSRQQH